MSILKENILEVNNRIEKAAKKSGRSAEDIELIAVTKTVDSETIKKAIDLGIKNIGENRVQELEEKHYDIGEIVNYHMIGHCQSNKARDLIDKVVLVHSLDRMSLAKQLNRRAKREDIVMDTLIQVNVSEEESKFGLKVEETIPFIEKILEYENINIRGLMTIAPHTDDEKILRESFIGLRELSEKIERNNYKNVKMDYLSMGMTNDYEIAIEEGSNMVRVGRAIFGDRNY